MGAINEKIFRCKYNSNISYDLYNVDRNKVYAFYESHDTFLNDGSMGYTKRLSTDEVIKNYKYACKDFPKTVFYNRVKTDMWSVWRGYSCIKK